MRSKQGRLRAFTLVELMVVVGIIGGAVGIILPAVQGSREAARRASCLNNMRQLGLGFQQFVQHHHRFPGGMNYYEVHSGNKTLKTEHGWAVYLLPYIEETALARHYDFKSFWKDPANLPAIRTEVNVFLCPSVPDSDTRVHRNEREQVDQGRIDYSTFAFVEDHFYANNPSIPSAALPHAGFAEGILVDWYQLPACKVYDGLSKTLLLTEDAGRPTHYIRHGTLANSAPNHSDGCNSALVKGHILGSGWAEPWNRNSLASMQYDGLTCFGPCVMNCTNNNEAFGFHPHGITSIMADSTAKFLSNEVENFVFAALVTRAGSEKVPVPE